MDIHQIFIQLMQVYCTDQAIINSYWHEIEKMYSSKKRYYHALSHIEALVDELDGVKHQVKDWDTLLFSVFYHDIIYNVLKSDNEEQSADLAVTRLSAIKFPVDKIAICKKQILSTKSHQYSNHIDTNLFTDADLSILGQTTDIYVAYCAQIRKEYSIYPAIIYNPGRRKVVKHFLDMERIFKTDSFYDKYEVRARTNLKHELEKLS